MVKLISLRLRNAEILAKARATLIRAGRGDELERAHTAAVMRQACATVARRQEQDRLRRVAALTAEKTILVVHKTYRAQDQLDADEAERARWHASRAVILGELNKIIAQGRRP